MSSFVWAAESCARIRAWPRGTTGCENATTYTPCSKMRSAALTAAETGHLVLSSIHTNDTSQTISRILDIFPAGHQSQIRQQLSLALLAIVTQQLVPAADIH